MLPSDPQCVRGSDRRSGSAAVRSSIGAKAGHRQRHRAMLGSDSRFLSHAGCKRKKDAGGRRYSPCLVPKVPGAEDARYRRCLKLKVRRCRRSKDVRRAEGTWCAEGDRCTEGTTKRITASSQPRDSADPCVIRSCIAAPKEEGPGSAQRGGGKAKYCVWSDAGDNSTMLRYASTTLR